VRESAHLTHDRLGGPRGGRACREQVVDRSVDRRVQGLLALDDLVDEADPLRPDRIEAPA
jgi:hypothetical protein